jgi:UPF0042 nucleotide-binding protein
MEIVLITGMSGSGKSVALNALEDAGYYCIDNLPPELLMPFAQLEHEQHARRLAIAIDVRSATALPQVPALLQALKEQGYTIKSLFLDASTETLVHRYSETRRRHPLSRPSSETHDIHRALIDAIELERSLLAELREPAHVIDTSLIRPTQLQAYIKDVIQLPDSQLTLVFESFSYKRGIPVDADYVFDVRMLPNPFYEPELRPLTGRDEPVATFLKAQPDVARMGEHIAQFFDAWLPALSHNHRSYVTVAIGCTGGQHRSVYLVETMAAHFAPRWHTLRRHRELD